LVDRGLVVPASAADDQHPALIDAADTGVSDR
jgi:hypothetical protein